VTHTGREGNRLGGKARQERQIPSTVKLGEPIDHQNTKELTGGGGGEKKGKGRKIQTGAGPAEKGYSSTPQRESIAKRNTIGTYNQRGEEKTEGKK